MAISEFTPLPLRARSVLELIDTSLKVYKQYFLVLLAWSAILSLSGNLLSLIPQVGSIFVWFSVLLTPIQIGVAACTVAAAVRGQNLTFKQCWEFSKARYGPMMGYFVLACILGFLCLLVLIIPGSVLIGFAAAGAGIAGGAGNNIALLVFTIALFLVGISFSMVAFYGWITMVPLVVCMEEQRPGSSPIQRTYHMLRGHWARLIGLTSVLGLAALVILAALGALAVVGMGLDEVRRSVTGGTPSPEFMRAILGLSISYSFVMMFLSPAMMLAMVLFYLDIRVRNEALDLEWAAHQSHTQEAPAPEFGSPAPAAPISAFQTPYQQPGADTAFADTPHSVEATAVEAPAVEAPAVEAPAAVPWQDLVTEPPAPVTDEPLPGNVVTLTCAQCGATSPANATFCIVCGTPLKANAG